MAAALRASIDLKSLQQCQVGRKFQVKVGGGRPHQPFFLLEI